MRPSSRSLLGLVIVALVVLTAPDILRGANNVYQMV